MAKRKVYLTIELDADETASILPPHLQGLLSRPLVDPLDVVSQQPPSIQTRKDGWFEQQTPKARRERKKAREQAEAKRQKDSKHAQ